MSLFNVFNNNKPKEDPERPLVRKYATAKLPGSDKRLVDVSRDVAKKLKMDPNMLASSFLVEGGNEIFREDGFPISTAYDVASRRGDFDQGEYMADAFYVAGLDNWGDIAPRLKKKGYIPENLDYQLYPAWNEAVEKNIVKRDSKGNITQYVMPEKLVRTAYEGQGDEQIAAIEEINKSLSKKGIKPNQTAAFRNYEDMILAKGAFLREFQDQVEDYANKKGVKMSDEEKNYLTMSAYNGGMGTAMDLIDMMKSGSKVVQTGGKNVAAHKNVGKRLKYMGFMGDLFTPMPVTGSIQSANK